MKKILILGTVLITLIYVMPFVYNGYYNGVTQTVNDNLSKNEAEYTFSDSEKEENSKNYVLDKTDEKIKALINGKVQEISLEEYVAGVVASEIPASFPLESIKAQAVAARTYIYYKKQNGGSDDAAHSGADVCDDPNHCTAYVDIETENIWGENTDKYRGIIKQAVYETKGEVITYDKEPIVAVFHSASSDKTESAQSVWGANMPYLTSVESYGGEDCPKFEGRVTVSAEEFRKTMSTRYEGIYLKTPPKTWFTASKRSDAGGIIEATVGGKSVKGSDIRNLFGLNSTNFTLETTEDSITFVTVGYGHGVGLSQYGARKMAIDGKTYKEILSHYYQKTSIQKIGD